MDYTLASRVERGGSPVPTEIIDDNVPVDDGLAATYKIHISYSITEVDVHDMAAIESLLNDFNGTEDTEMADGDETDHVPEQPKPRALLRSSSSLVIGSYYADEPPAFTASPTQPLQEYQDFDSEMVLSDGEVTSGSDVAFDDDWATEEELAIEAADHYKTSSSPRAVSDDDGDYDVLSSSDYSWGYGIVLPEGYTAPTPRALSTTPTPDHSVHTYEPFKAQREDIATGLQAPSNESFDAPPSSQEPLDPDIALYNAPQQEEVNDVTEISDVEFIDETSAEATTPSETTPAAEQYGDEDEDADIDEASAEATTPSEATSAVEQFGDHWQYEDTDNEDDYDFDGGSTTSIGALAPQNSYDLLAGPVMGDATYAGTDANSVIAAVFGNADYESDEDDEAAPVMTTNCKKADDKPEEDDESSEEEDNGPETPKDAQKIRPKLYFDDGAQKLQTREAMYMIIDHHARGAGSSIDEEKEQFIRANMPKSRTGHPSSIVRSTSSFLRFYDEIAPGPGEHRQ